MYFWLGWALLDVTRSNSGKRSAHNHLPLFQNRILSGNSISDSDYSGSLIPFYCFICLLPHFIVATSKPMKPLLLIALSGLMPNVSTAFSSPRTAFRSVNVLRSQHTVHENDTINTPKSHKNHSRKEFLLISSAIASMFTFPSSIRADQTEYLYQRPSSEEGDLTSRLFNPDGSLRDPNTVTEAQERTVKLPFPLSKSADFKVNVSTDGSRPTTENTGFEVSYNLPTKWNNDQSSLLPLYYDSSEGKNGKACNRITVYSVTSPKLDNTVLEKASKVGVAKSIFMDKLPNTYFDQGVLKADLISGRTTRKAIKNGSMIDEQIYYEFDLAFAPLSCPAYEEGNKENLGLGFCPYDAIYLVSATVLDDDGSMVVCVVECNKDEWKIANSDLKRVRSSFEVNRI